MVINKDAWAAVTQYFPTHEITINGGPCCERCNNFYVVAQAAYTMGRNSVQDDQEADGTDFAHPAWHRGNDHAFLMAVHEVNDILDGTASNVGMSIEPWQSLRQRLYDIRTLLGIAERVMDNTNVGALSRMQWFKVRKDYSERLLSRGYCGKCGDSKPECKCK